MRYGIFSDVHSNLEALEAVILAFQKEEIDRYLCLGDIVGYGANPKECIQKVRSLTDICCAGNHDWATVNLFALDYLNSEAAFAVLWTKRLLNAQEKSYLEALKLVYKNKDLVLVHGTLDNPQEFNYLTNVYIAEETFRLMETNICFIGHTHIPSIFNKVGNDHVYCFKESNIRLEEKSKYIINVGSVGQPRDGNPKAAFCVYDTKTKEVQIKRTGYDIKTARKKILNEEMPEFLGDRLIIGR